MRKEEPIGFGVVPGHGQSVCVANFPFCDCLVAGRAGNTTHFNPESDGRLSNYNILVAGRAKNTTNIDPVSDGG